MGFARIDLFTPAFTSDKPVTYIPRTDASLRRQRSAN